MLIINFLLSELGWPTLSARCTHHCLCVYFKLIKKGPSYLTNLLPTPVANLTPYNLRNQTELPTPQTRLKSSNTSFIPSVTKIWNKLPITTRNAHSYNIFKKLTKPFTQSSIYNKLCSGFHGRLLTRLRLRLSGLNAHRFKYNLCNTPICSLCNLSPEDNIHYFFYCPSHDFARLHFLNLLNFELDLDTSDKQKTLDIILYGKINHNQHHLLQFIYQYINHTGRFQIHYLTTTTTTNYINKALYGTDSHLGERPVAHGCSAILAFIAKIKFI